FSASSVILNCAFELEDVAAIDHGRELAKQALGATTPDEPLHFQCRYNIANATNTLCEPELPEAVDGATRVDWEPHLIRSRLKTRTELQHARREYFEIGTSQVADARTRSASYCNLGNLLDHSGRWAEAYDFYLRALEADGSNGNAAGNLAQLLRTRIATGIGQTGHIAGVYDTCLSLAQDLREGTLAYAAAAVADRWEQLAPTESEGHLAVVPTEVGYAAGWWVALQRGVAAVMIIGVEEGGELCEALGFAGVGARVGPFLFQGAVEPLDLAVGLGPVGAGAFVRDLLAQGGGEGL